MTSTDKNSKPAAIAEMRAQLRGSVLTSQDPGYNAARRGWNGTVDRHPAVIAQCSDAEDVAVAVRVAAEHGLALTVRGGAHNVAGRSVADAAVLLDLARMRGVEINATSRRAVAQGGARWHELDLAGARHGLATTGGLISSTGVVGLTLGGGVGWLMRRFGLACDNMRAAQVVLADGRYVRASDDEHPELFWALRGGGHGLGVLISTEFELHPLTQVYAGLIVRPATEAAAALRVFRDFAQTAPDEFCGMMALAGAPPLPFLDPSWHGRPVAITAMCWSGDIAAAERAVAPLREFGAPLTVHLGPMPYVVWQHAQDGSAPPGRCNYWKTASFADLPDELIAELSAALQALPSPQTEIHVQHLGGAVARGDAEAGAFAQRQTQFFVNVIGVTPWHDQLAELRARVRALHGRISAYALGEQLHNFTDSDDGDSRPRASLRRLQEVRRTYDPDGRFSIAV